MSTKELQEKTRHDIDDAFREIGSLEKRFDYRSVDGPLWKFNNATALRRQDDELLPAKETCGLGE